MNQQAEMIKQSPGGALGVITKPDAVRIERILPGPIERVWSYLTESGKRATWLAAGEMDLRPGGRIHYVFNHANLTEHDEVPPAKYAQYAGETRMSGKVIACDPPRHLVQTWEEDSGVDSEVTIDLSEVGDKVRLVLTHRRLQSRDEVIGVAAGWHAHLDILVDRLNGRSPKPFWTTHGDLEDVYGRLI